MRMIWPLVLLLCTAAWAAAEKEITVELTVPDAAWTIAIDEVYQVGDELWVVCLVSRNPDMTGAQVISTVQASLKVAAPDLPMEYFIIGKDWGWENEEPFNFIKDRKQIEEGLEHGRVLYKSSKPNPRCE